MDHKLSPADQQTDSTDEETDHHGIPPRTWPTSVLTVATKSGRYLAQVIQDDNVNSDDDDSDDEEQLNQWTEAGRRVRHMTKLLEDSREKQVVNLKAYFEQMSTGCETLIPSGDCVASATKVQDGFDEVINNMTPHWNDLNTEKILMYLKFDGDVARDLLDALVVEVHPGAARSTDLASYPFRRRRLQPSGFRFRVGLANEVPKCIDTRAHIWSSIAPRIRKVKGQAVAIRFFWSPFSYLLGGAHDPATKRIQGANMGVALMDNQIKVLHGILRTSPQSGCLKTVMGKAIVTRAANRVSLMFVVARLVDFAYLGLLYGVVSHIHMKNMPPKRLTFPLMGLSILALVEKLVEMVTTILIFGMDNAWRVYGTAWNLLFLLAELYNALAVLVPIVAASMSGADSCTKENCALARHPIYLSGAVLGRWVYLLISCLSLQVFGRTVLPAFQAAMSAASLTFLIYASLFTIGLLNSYWALPVNDNIMDTWFKIMRLVAFTDFDINEMEGANSYVHHMPTSPDWQIMDPNAEVSGTQRWHWGVRVLVVCYGFISVMSMNVYIGILSMEYEAAKNDSDSVILRFKGQLSLPFLLQMRFWKMVFRGKVEEQRSVWITTPPTRSSAS